MNDKLCKNKPRHDIKHGIELCYCARCGKVFFKGNYPFFTESMQRGDIRGIEKTAICLNKRLELVTTS